jgi:hypothetical protein
MNNGSVLIDSLLVTWTRSRLFVKVDASKSSEVQTQSEEVERGLHLLIPR